MPKEPPRVRFATFCEKALVEKDGVLSLIRVVDRLTITMRKGDELLDEALPPMQVPTTLVIGLGDLTPGARYSFRLEAEPPSGERRSLGIDWHPTPDDDRLATWLLNLTLTIEGEGRHWLILMAEDEEITRVPLQVLRGQESHATSAAASTETPPGA